MSFRGAPGPSGMNITGDIWLPGNSEYDNQRRVVNPALDPRPSAVVEACGVADVQAVVRWARDEDLGLAIQSTGHGTHVAARGGLLLKTSRMATVLVDPERRVARVGAGATWGQVLAAAAPFGLAPLSGSSPTVGVAGYTLGGGVGWLSRLHGFAADSLMRVALVTAGGELVIADRDQEPDLFWAVRGGGGNFGVVTGLELELFPVREVYAGTTYFDFERAPDTLGRYADWLDEAPPELSTALLLMRMPETPDVPQQLRGRRVLALRAMYAGAAEDAERALAPMRAVAGVSLLEGFASTRFADARMGGTPPRQLELLNGLPDRLIESLVSAVEDERVSTIELRHWGGAMASGDGAVGHRSVPLSVIADTTDAELSGALQPWATGGTFLNFLSDVSRTASAYTPENYARLRDVKAEWDPDNFFSFGHNIEPSHAVNTIGTLPRERMESSAPWEALA
jgi:FAD/FMN-containing dehydrogenase